MADESGILWLIVNVVLVIVLGGAIAYGIMAWRRRSRDPAVKRAGEEQVRRNYAEEDRKAPD